MGWSTFSTPSSLGSFSVETMLVLTDGSVLMQASNSVNWARLRPDAQGNYDTGSWSGPYAMTNSRQYFSSAVLNDGRVYVVGGESSSAGSDGSLGEIFDPGTNLWSPMTKPSAFSYIQGDASGCVLADGRVLFGNLTTTSPPFATALWDPVTNDWTVAGSAFGTLTTDTKQANCNEETWTLLPDGSVLTADTLNSPNAERYIPSLDIWVLAAATKSNLVLTRITDPSHNVVNIFEIGPAILLPDGTVFAMGATGQTGIYSPPPAGSNPRTTTGTWAKGPAFPNDTSSGNIWPTLTASDGPGVLQTNGKVVFAAGILYERSGAQLDYFSKQAQLYEYDPSAGTIKAFGSQPFSASGAPDTWQLRMLLLPNGQILLSQQSGTVNIYKPTTSENSPKAAWKPKITAHPDTLVPGHTYTLSGQQLNGLSQANSYGDDAQMATNWPLVRLTNSAGDVQYAKTSSFSTMGVATGMTTVSTDLSVPQMAAGDWDLAVVANGIPSNTVSVQVVEQDCRIILDRDTYGEGEIKAIINNAGAPAVVNPALYVVVEGYRASDIGLTAANLGNPPHRPDIPDPLTGIHAAFVGPVRADDETVPPGEVQSFTFAYELQFSGASVFAGAPESVPLTATFSPPGQTSVHAAASINLITNPDPFILHGDEAAGYPWYLSTDLRVFQMTAGQTRFGKELAASSAADTAATTFIQGVVKNLNADPGAAGPLFDAIAQDETSTALSVLPTNSSGTAVYNFAVARVRLQDVAKATDVGVFFRLWQAQQTNATYDAATTYASRTNAAGEQIPILGAIGDEIMTIPFFASPRIDSATASMATQADPHNRRTIQPDALGGQTDAYFGCWLDINQPGEPRFPDRMVGGNPANLPQGPFTGMGTLLSIQQLVRSDHQCLIAEINYTPDPPRAGSDPSNSDKLAQRNLTLVPAPNPGTPPSRQVPQTIIIRPTPVPLAPGLRPDELMIDWGDVPAGATAQLYLPAAPAAQIVEFASTLYAGHRLSVVDAHTVGIEGGGVTYVPIPAGGAGVLAGLLTAALPFGIKRGQEFDVVVRQLTTVASGRGRINADLETAAAVGAPVPWQRVLGTFKLTIPIQTKSSLRETEEHLLSVMRWIGKSIPVESIWFPVFERYLTQLGQRAGEMGGQPGSVVASPTGGIVIGGGHHGAGGHGGTGGGRGEGELGDLCEYTGKIEGLIHDRFGDFEGFVLVLRDTGHHRRFFSREERIARLAERTWEHRTTVSVLTGHDEPERPVEIILW